jgi:hypothetical protein
MTTAPARARRNGRADFPASVPPEGLPTGTGRAGEGWFARHPEWPITFFLAGYPLWWVLGFADYMPILLSVPMVRRMYRWRAMRERSLRFPPGIGLWLMFLVVAIAGVAMLSQTAPLTMVSPTSTRAISYGLRTASYVCVTVLLLYAGNLTEEELPRRRMAWLLGLVGIYATAGGLLGMADPSFSFTSPLAYVVPQSIQNNNAQLAIILHPGSSQIQNILGYAEGRPKAPFDYTNMWGECLAILLPWLTVAWWSHGTRRQRQACALILLIALAPVVYSLDRGLWLGLACAFVYLAVRSAMRGKLAMLGVLLSVAAVAGILLTLTPVGGFVSARLSHGASNTVRTSLSQIAITDGEASPMLGYGDSRHAQGSPNSIAVGKTASCHGCGSRSIGGNGQLWLLLVCSGILGAALYLGFFAYGSWRFWRDPTPYGMVGVLVLLLGFVFMIAYVAVGPPLSFMMLSYALLWRNDRELRRQRAAPPESSGPPTLAAAPPRAITAGGPA